MPISEPTEERTTPTVPPSRNHQRKTSNSKNEIQQPTPRQQQQPTKLQQNPSFSNVAPSASPQPSNNSGNVLKAVSLLLGELSEDDLQLLKIEIDQKLRLLK